VTTRHTATRLTNGKILVAGGFGRNGPTNSAELYDPNTGTWTNTGSLPISIYGHTATLLPSGKVLVAGGQGPGGISPKAEVFDPASGPNGRWTAVEPMNSPRRFHSATLLSNGKVLVAGGQANGVTPVSSAELFDPATGKWAPTTPLGNARVAHQAIVLPDGKVMVAGGQDTNFLVTSVTELYDVGLGFAGSWRPQIATLTSPLNLGASLALAGSRFRGVSQGSGGNSSQSSPGDCPVIQLRSVESGQVLFLSSTNWQADSFVSLPVTNFPAGWALATVFVNGIPSVSGILVVTPTPTPILLKNSTKIGNGSFQFSFTNTIGAVFTVLAATNISLPSSNWTVLGSPTETASGQFQFVDPQATANPQRFYRVRSP
jgi:hypothetical protein